MSSTQGVGQASSSSLPPIAHNQPSSRPKLSKTQRRRNRKRRNRGRRTPQSTANSLPARSHDRNGLSMPHAIPTSGIAGPSLSLSRQALAQANLLQQPSHRRFQSRSLNRPDDPWYASSLAANASSSSDNAVPGPSSAPAAIPSSFTNAADGLSSDDSSSASNHPRSSSSRSAARRAPFCLRPGRNQQVQRSPVLMSKHQVRPPRCHHRHPLAPVVAELWTKAKIVMEAEELIALRDWVEIAVKRDRRPDKRRQPSWYETQASSSSDDDDNNGNDVPLRRVKRRLNAFAMPSISDNENGDNASADGGDEGDVRDLVHENELLRSRHVPGDVFSGCDRGA